MTRARIALTIAGSDSGGGAGIQADLKTFAALGVYGASAITAVTAQDTRRVYSFTELRPDLVAAQIDAVMDDMGADAVKTGMLASTPIIEAVADRLRHWNVTNLVIDPVMVAKGGDTLLRPDAVDALKRLLIPMALVLTPNLPEAEVLVGSSISTFDEIKAAAEEMASWGVANVVIKGGHSEGPMATDLLYDGKGFREFSAPRIHTQNTHGTGCTFASAIAATLAKQDTVPNAIASAKAYVTLALQNSYAIGEGHSPVHHFYRYWRPHINEVTNA